MTPLLPFSPQGESILEKFMKQTKPEDLNVQSGQETTYPGQQALSASDVWVLTLVVFTPRNLL